MDKRALIQTIVVPSTPDLTLFSKIMNPAYQCSQICRRRVSLEGRLTGRMEKFDIEDLKWRKFTTGLVKPLGYYFKYYYFVETEFEQHSGTNTAEDFRFGSTLVNEGTNIKIDHDRTTSKIKRPDPTSKMMQESRIEYSNIVKKWYVVHTGVWSVADTDGTILASFAIPTDLINNCQQRQPFNNNLLFRGDVDVKIKVNSTQFHQGLLYMGYAPSITKDVANLLYPNKRTMLSNLPCGYVNAFAPNEIMLRIPHTNPRDYIFTNQSGTTSLEGCYGTLMVAVFNQLMAATGSTTTVNYTIWVSIPNAEFYLPTPISVCSELDVRRHLCAPEKFEKHGGRNSTHKTVIINYGGVNDSCINSELEGDDFDTSQSASADIQASNGAMMDKPFICTNSIPAVRKAAGFLNAKSNLEFVDKLTNNQNEMAISKFHHFSRDKDEMLLAQMLSITSFAGEVQWTTSSAADTQIMSGLITPAPINTTFRSAATNPVYAQQQTIMDYLSGQFTYWSGPINMHVKIMAAAFQTGMLRVSAVYGDYTFASSSSAANCQWASYIDLKDNKREYDFTFEFPATVPYLRCNTKKDISLSQAEKVARTLGSWYVHVINPLTVGPGLPTVVTLMVFFSGPSLQYYFQRKSRVVPTDFEPEFVQDERKKEDELLNFDFIDTFEKHGDEVVTQDKPEDQKKQATKGIILGTDPKYLPPKRSLNIQPTTSIRDLIKRYVLVNKQTSSTEFVFGNLNLQNVVAAEANSWWTWSCLYAGWRGCIRLKICYRTEPATAARPSYVAWTPLTFTPDNIGTNSRQCNFTNMAIVPTPVHEVECSFTTEFGYLMHAEYAAAADVQFTYHGSLKIDSVIMFWDIWVAGGDDLRFGIFLGPPLCAVYDD